MCCECCVVVCCEFCVLWVLCVVIVVCCECCFLWLLCVVSFVCCDCCVLWVLCAVSVVCCDYCVLWVLCVVSFVCCECCVLWLLCVVSVVCCECCVLLCRGLYDELITRLEESYLLWWVVVCVLYKPHEWGAPGPLAAIQPQTNKEANPVSISPFCTFYRNTKGINAYVNRDRPGLYADTQNISPFTIWMAYWS